MKITKQARREAKELFRRSLQDGVLQDDRVRHIVQQVLEAKPRRYLSVLAHYRRLIQLEIERRTARVESAVPLTPELEHQLKAQLSSSYGPGLKLFFSHNPALLGGMRVKVGSDVYDGSVQGRLAALQEQF